MSASDDREMHERESSVEFINCNFEEQMEVDEGECNDNQIPVPVIAVIGVESAQNESPICVPDSAVKGKGKAKKPREKDDSQKKSIAWTYFTRVGKTDKAACNHCGLVMGCHAKNDGTSGMVHHIEKCKSLNLPTKNLQQSLLNFKPGYNDPNVGGALAFRKYDQDTVRKALAMMICLDELPYKFVEGSGFKNFISVACPLFNVPSRWTVARDIFAVFEEEKLKLKKYFKFSNQRVCLTTDTWTSNQRVNYMCLTVHFIDSEWRLNKKIINFCPISSHKGEAIGRLIEECLLEWGIRKIYTVTVDNASSNDTAMAYLARITRRDSVYNATCLHMQCAAHILNLVVMDGLKEKSASITRIRGAVYYIRNGTERLKLFVNCVKKAKIESKKLLTLDVPTRWNSTYTMLDNAYSLKDAFDRFEFEDPHYKTELALKFGVPTSDDWAAANKFVMFFERFFDLTKKVSGHLYVTSNMFFREISVLYNDLQAFKNGDDEDLVNMATKMLEKFHKYWGDVEKMNMNIFFGTIMDPRLKFGYVEYILQKLHPGPKGVSFSESVKNALFAVFEEYQRVYELEVGTTHTQQNIPNVVQTEHSSKRNKISNTLDDGFEQYEASRTNLNLQSDLDRYLAEIKVPKSTDIDILQWWKNNNERYPVLSAMARDVLAIPISTVASESAFSTGGRVLDQFRNSLTPKSVEALICGQDWLRGFKEPMNVEEKLLDLENFEKGIDAACLLELDGGGAMVEALSYGCQLLLVYYA